MASESAGIDWLKVGLLGLATLVFVVWLIAMNGAIEDAEFDLEEKHGDD